MRGERALRVYPESNDARSLALFAGVSFAAFSSARDAGGFWCRSPCTIRGHAPIYGWMGYLIRWVPIVTLIGALLFARGRWRGTFAPFRGKTSFSLRRRFGRAAALPHRRAADNCGRIADALCRRHRQSGAQRLRLRYSSEGCRARLHARADRRIGRRTNWRAVVAHGNRPYRERGPSA